uniref:BDP1ral transcription factor IIIB subunit n=1 Tax=Sus scrofa TaxID=9823 RepID=A0A8D1A290_PIG
MFRRARLSVKPNVRPGAGARGSTAPNPQREQEAPRPPESAAASVPKPAEPKDVPPVDSGEAEPQEKTPKSSDEKTDGGNNVEESSKSSPTVSQRRKRLSSTSSVVKPSVSVPSEPHPLSTVNNQEAPQPNPVPTKEKQPCSDRFRIYKAQKLREMLKEELRKEKKQWKNKHAVNENQRPQDRSKMTMRDFIYYLPNNNPMTSSLEQEKKTEKSSTPVQTREQEGKSTPDGEDNEEIEEEMDDGPLLVPRVKVAEDGSIILDEESLTVEVLRTKGPCVVEENDPIFERGSTTTYSSFRKNYYSKPWSNKETDMFFLAISMVGTDFSMIGQLFPHRARIEIKNKFKREEKTNGWRIDKAFQEKRPFDFDFFAHLLQKVLAEEEKRKQKSVKNQSSKEKSSKSRKNVKVKKVTNERVSDDPAESVSARISDAEGSQKDTQTVEEEQQSLTLSAQDSEQNVVEQDQNQKKRRRKNQGEGGKREVKSLSGNASVQPGSSKGEKHTNQSLSPEINEEGGNKEQNLPSVQNKDDIVGLSFSEKTERRTDPVLSSSGEQDDVSVAAETLESGTSDLPSSEVGVRPLCEVINAERSCTEERNVDPKNKSLETDQTENVKPMKRVRLQRPKPNLSRAVGKKTVLLQDKTDEENKSSHAETSVEKNHVEKDKTSTSDISVVENTERENPEADAVSNLSEKICLQEDDAPKVFRPARLMRGSLRRQKPNIGKAAERKGILTSQEKFGATVEKNENESGIGGDTPEQIEDQSCKNFECEDITSQSEEKDTSIQDAQSDDPKALNECPSIQEDNKANKQVPVVKTRFQKPKPNIRRTIAKRDISSKKEVPEKILASEEITAALGETASLETSPREEVPVETNTTKETESGLKETGKDSSPREKIPEMIDVTVEMETDLKETEMKDISPREKIPEMSGVTVEMETDLKETGREVFPREEEEIPKVTDATEERETDLEETVRREISLQENAPEEIDTISEVVTDLKETVREISPREKIPDIIDAAEEAETDLEESERREISTQDKVSEVKTVGDEVDSELKEIGIEISLRENVVVGIRDTGEREVDLEETAERDFSLVEKVSGKMTAIEETEADLKETGKEIFLKKSRPEEISASEDRVADLEKIRKTDISLRENAREETGTSRQTGTDSLQSSSADCSAVPSLTNNDISSEILSVVHTAVEENRNSEKEMSSQLSHLNISLETSGLDKIEDQRMQSPDVPEQSSDINLSKSLPQEQKPSEVKPAPFLRSRFKRPKPNLARAASKREATGAEKCAPGKNMEPDKVGTVVIQPNSDQMSTLSSQHDVASLMTSREKDKSDHSQEETVILPHGQTEKELSPSSSHEPKEESQSTQAQGKELVVSIGTHDINTLERESAVQTVPPVRGRLQRPRPNLRRVGQRQVIEKSEAKETNKEEGTLQKDETKKEFLTVPNSQIAPEIEVVSSKVSEGRTCEIEVVSAKGSEGRTGENQSHVVLLENLHLNEVNALDEKTRQERKTYVPSPPRMIRRQFQKPKPNLGRAHARKEESSIEKDRADQSEARKPEDNLLQHGDSDTQFLQKEKAESLTSLKVSARKDSVGSQETGLAKKDAQSEAGPSQSVGEKTVGDDSGCSVVEEQYLSKPTRFPQLPKESNHSRIALDRRTALSSASECETDHSERRIHRRVKPNVTRGRGSKRVRSKTSKKEPRAPKAVLVTLRASQEEDEDDAEDFESDYEEESYHLAPEEVNKAPVFVPVGLRSPEPVPTQIEETMEELEITVNVPDVGCIAVVEHQLSNADVTTQEMKQEENLNASSVEMTTGEHSQDETGTNDGSTEAAITLLTMGDLVLQSEISTEQSGVGVCILPDGHSEDKSHVPFSPDNINHDIVHEHPELSSPLCSTSPSEDNKIVLEEQSTKEETGLVEEVKENAISTRTTTSEVTSSLRPRRRFAKPKPNLKKILGTKRFGAHQEVPSLSEIQGETEKNASKGTELEDKNLGSDTTAESKEQSKLACVHGIEETSNSQEARLTKRNEDHEEGSEEVQMLSAAPLVSSEPSTDTLALGTSLGESFIEEPLRKDSDGDSMLTLYVPEQCPPASIPDVQQENVNNPQDSVDLLANVHQDGEDEQAFILTLVEIPTSAVEEYADTTTQLLPNTLLPAPILVKSVNKEERGDMSVSFPVIPVDQDAVYLSGRDDSEKPPANLELLSRKRFHCSPDESDHVPPAKKNSLTSSDDCQKYTSEVCSKELINLEETGESCQGQDNFPTLGSTLTMPEPQKEQLESTFQSIGSRSPDKVTDTQEKNASELPQDEIMVSDKEERTCAASMSMDNITSSSKTPLSRPGRRPLGFLSLICSKNSLESDEPTQVHRKKRLKPLIPISRKNLQVSNPLSESQKTTPEPSDPPPSPSVVANTQSTNTGNTGSSATQVSSNPLPKEECKGGQKRVPEEEPTTISEYFFSDIFIQVDETE